MFTAGGVRWLSFFSCKVDFTRHVRGLPQRSQRHAFEQSLGAFVFDDGVGRLSSVAIFGHVAGFSVAAFLALQSDLKDFHRRNHGDCFCDAGCYTSYIMVYFVTTGLESGHS